MDILLFGMKPDLAKWERRSIHPLAPAEKVPNPYHDRRVATLALEAPGEPEEDGPFARLEESVLAYQVFGPEIGTPLVRRCPVQVGDTVGLDYHFLGPIRILIASRVVRVFHRERTEEGWRSGFVYQTLQGHPELGEEIFEVTKCETGAVKFRLEAWSRPNLWLIKMLTPWARAIQHQAGESALRNLLNVAGGRF